MLALLAFMLAFTFGIASNRFDARKELVREDATRSGPPGCKATFLPEPDRAEANGFFRDYLKARVGWFNRPTRSA